MSLEFRIGGHVGPSGVNLGFVELPAISPEQNISIIDQSYKWEENVSNIDAGVIEGYVGQDGLLPKMTVTDFVVSNVTTDVKPDAPATPLYYSHTCRFFHYSYGANPTKHVYITDQDNNILKGINYKVWARRMGDNLFQIQVLTDFQNNEYVQYRVRYNRTDSTASSIYPSWLETLNATPLFNEGVPSVNLYEYALLGPDNNGLYQVDVPPVPTLGEFKNSIGISFELSPAFIEGDPPSIVPHTASVTYTLKATGTATFTIARNKTPLGAPTTDVYLQTLAGNVWGSGAVNFDLGDSAKFDGIRVDVGSDNYLNTNDEAFFVASPSYYYLKPVKFKAIYLAKPTNVSADDDWYIKIKAGSFTRRMNDSGEVVPSGQGTQWQYYISEYDENPWSLIYGRPYVGITSEEPNILDANTIKVKHTPLFIEPSDVFYNGGFPPSGFLNVQLNNEQIPEEDITDWDVYNGTVRVAQTLGVTDDVKINYNYREDYYEYQGFVGSGKLYPEEGPFNWFPLEVNPTPMHNHGMYASGVTAHIFIGPSWDLDNEIFFDEAPCYHNFTGDPSGNLDFYLGSVSLAPNARASDADVTDTRTRGGGLIEDVDLDLVEEVQPESQFYWDIGYFDGKAFPSNGVLVIEVPKALQNREEEIREKVYRHLAYGEYAIIDFV
jgi:hypothetical protein